MRILVVHGQQLEHYPPVNTLVNTLTENGHLVTLITKFYEEPKVQNRSCLQTIKLPNNENIMSFTNAIAYIKKRKHMQYLVKREMQHNDILWTTTDSTIRDLGKIIYNYKHVMQLMELIEDMPAIPGLSYPKMNIKKYAQRAYKVVVPEYNRAHIQKVWWRLPELPVVLPNKMFSVDISEPPSEVAEIIKNLEQEKRKIILYQGSFREDRNLTKYAEAISSMEDKYVLYIMGADSPLRKELCEKFPDIKYIPFISPPYHLLVSRKAYIGLLPYVPEKIGYNSILNALYCAPNKIFEFSGFGIPMIGNDVPGLSIPFENYNIGRICKKANIEEIIGLIISISKDYDVISKNCIDYFNSIDLNQIVNDILH